MLPKEIRMKKLYEFIVKWYDYIIEKEKLIELLDYTELEYNEFTKEYKCNENYDYLEFYEMS